MKHYSISKIYGSLLADDNIVEAKNSKYALEKFLNKKVIRTEDNPTYSVIECDPNGHLHYDRRKWLYYKIKKLI